MLLIRIIGPIVCVHVGGLRAAVDPGKRSNSLFEKIYELRLKVELIVLTVEIHSARHGS